MQQEIAMFLRKGWGMLGITMEIIGGGGRGGTGEGGMLFG